MIRRTVQAGLMGWAMLAVLLGRGSATEPNPSVGLLSKQMRSMIIQQLPPVLYEDARHWDLKKQTKRGSVKHGPWRRVKFSTRNLDRSLVFELRDLKPQGPRRTTFSIHLAFDAHVDYEQQNWRSGIRLYQGSVRARLRLMLTLNCEVTSRVEKSAGLIPDLVFRVRVVGSDVRYSDLVFEHVGKLGGDAARVLGGALHDGLSQWKPSLERNLLTKANTAIVKAADTKEVRVSLTKLLK